MAQINKSTLAWIREAGLPEISEEQIETLAARLREAYAAEAMKEQIGADRTRNVGGSEGPWDTVEDGSPPLIMLEQARD